MLEIKHLSKIYKTKGGIETRALDDVSINFASTGLVFLLGKSGSGKSTLLNLAGGLDEPTSGEVIVMGKSSRDFSGSDFDSYRNTYVGFVFQEYNILNEFNVEDNIALSLELQGKKKDRDKINKLLEEVDLTQFAKRKPNTLSGGQKQRIAIARALIKDPQIIMADEPTGALDSNTGKQVMETLKKLSATRLVLVVSHDREFAELYGDRVVELKDGKVISDVTKVHVEAETVSGNIIKLGNDTITVKKGAKLTASDVKTLQKFISEGESDVLVSKSDRDIASFKRANRIDDEGRRESFSDTPADNVKPYEGEKAKFIRSRLPARKAIKIGASGLRLKPFRLILTILLSIISFVMFGLFSTMMVYDPNKVATESFLNSDYEYLTVEKYYATHVQSRYGDYDYTQQTQLTPKEIEDFGDGAFGAYAAHVDKPANVTVVASKNYYFPSIYRVAVLPEGHPLREQMQGTYPKDANEIVVSSYFLEVAKNATFKTVSDYNEIGSEKKINSAADLIGQNISIMSAAVKVTGVFDSGEIPSKYDGIKDDLADGYGLENFIYEAYLAEGMHTIAFVSEEFIKEHAEDLGSYYDYVEYFLYSQNSFEFYSFDTESTCHYTQELRVYDKETISNPLEILWLNEVDALQDYQVILPLGAAYATIYEWFWGEYQTSFWDNWEDNFDSYDDAQLEWEKLEQDFYDFEQAYDTIYNNASEKELAAAKEVALDYIKAHAQKIGMRVDGASLGEVELVGVYLPDERYGASGFYCSQSVYDLATFYFYYDDEYKAETKYEREEDARFDCVIVPFDKTEQSLNDILSRINVLDEDTDVVYQLNNMLYQNIEFVNEIVATLSTIFLWVGVGLAVFAALMLFNFISVSISSKKKEIGILRAVGARGLDVFKIFFAESSIIVSICVALSIIGSAIAATFINAVLKAEAGLDVALFVFGPLSVALMIGVALVVAFVSTFLPVYFAARKKPVESIRAL